MQKLLKKCIHDKKEYPALQQKLAGMVNLEKKSAGEAVAPASTSTCAKMASAMVTLMAISGMMGPGSEQHNSDPCNTDRFQAPVSQILEPPLADGVRAARQSHR
jgi:hypothetical protein